MQGKGEEPARHGDVDDDTVESVAAGRAVWWLALPALVTLLLATSRLASPAMSGVEADTYWVARQPAGTLVHVLHHVDVVHGVYYAGVHALFLLFGPSVLLMRLPSVVGGVAAVVLVGLLGRCVTGSMRVGFLAATTLALSPLFSGYVQLARSYALVTALVLLATLILMRCIRPAAGRWWWLFTVVLVGVIYLHEFAVLALAGLAVTLLWARVDRRTFLRFVAHSALAVALAVPLIVESTAQGNQLSFLKSPDLFTVEALARNFFGPAPVLATVGGVLAMIAIVGLRTPRPGVTLPRLAVPLLVLPPALLLVESVVGRPLFAGARYVLYSLPAASLLMAGGLHVLIGIVATRSAQLRRFAAVGVCGLAVIGLALTQSQPLVRVHSEAAQGQNFLAAADVLQHRSRPGDAVAYVPQSLTGIALAYPRQVRNLIDVEVRLSNVRSGTLYGIRRRGVRFRLALLRLPRIWLVTSVPKTQQGRQSDQLLESHDFEPEMHARAVGVALTLFVRR